MPDQPTLDLNERLALALGWRKTQPDGLWIRTDRRPILRIDFDSDPAASSVLKEAMRARGWLLTLEDRGGRWTAWYIKQGVGGTGRNGNTEPAAVALAAEAALESEATHADH